MYTCDWQTAETVYHGVKMSLETDSAHEHSFFISSPAQTSFAFPLLSMNDGKKKSKIPKGTDSFPGVESPPVAGFLAGVWQVSLPGNL